MRTSLRKIQRDIMARKGRTFLVSSAIFIGVMGTVALFSMGDILLTQLRKDIREDEVAMVNILVTVNLIAPLNDSGYLDELREFPGITEVQASTQETVKFKTNDDQSLYYEANILSYSEPFDHLQIEPMQKIEGDYPLAGQNQVMVERRFADKYDLEVGDPLYFQVAGPSRNPNTFGWLGREERWTISGIVFHPYVLSPSNSIYAQNSDNNYLTGTRGYNVFSARFTDYPIAHRQAGRFSDLIQNDTPYLPVFTQRQDPAQNPLLVGAERLTQTLNTLALISLFVSAFLVFNVVSSIVGEQRRQIGSMKAIGATRLDMFAMYCGLALSYGLLGVIPGVLVGVPLGYFIADFLADQVNTLLEGFTISYTSVLIGVAAGLGVPLLSSILPVWDGSRITILEAMSDVGIKGTYNATPADRFINLLPSQSIRLALRNMTLKKIRLSLTILTLAIAVGSFMGIFAVFTSVSKEITDFFDNFDSSIAITPDIQSNPEAVIDVLESYLRQHPELGASVEQGFQLPVEIEGFDTPIDLDEVPGITAYGYDFYELDVPISEGEALQAGNADYGVVLSSTLANQLDKDVGDQIKITILGRTAELTVVGITDTPTQEMWMSRETMALAAGYAQYLPRPNEYLSEVKIGVDDNDVAVLGLDPERAANIQLTSGTFFEPGRPTVVISEAMALAGDYEVGDRILLRSEGESKLFPISGIFTPPPELEESADVPEQFIAIYWADLAQLEGRSLDEIPLPQAYFLDDLDGLSVEELDSLTNDLDTILTRVGLPSSLFNFVGLLEALSANLRTFQAILSAVALLIALVGALGLLSTLSISVMERQREIGVMRSVGASSARILRQFLIEGLFAGFLAWLLGLPIGYFLASLLLDVTGLSDRLDVIFTVNAALVGLSGILLVTAAASLWPAYGASRRTVSEIIRYS
jgi:ABC-type antimicrobial peptide transport system permease subunit